MGATINSCCERQNVVLTEDYVTVVETVQLQQLADVMPERNGRDEEVAGKRKKKISITRVIHSSSQSTPSVDLINTQTRLNSCQLNNKTVSRCDQSTVYYITVSIDMTKHSAR